MKLPKLETLIQLVMVLGVGLWVLGEFVLGNKRLSAIGFLLFGLPTLAVVILAALLLAWFIVRAPFRWLKSRSSANHDEEGHPRN